VVEQSVIDYAFSELKLEYLYAIIFEPYIASKHVFEKLGFKQYGVKPAATYIDGLGSLFVEERPVMVGQRFFPKTILMF
jgi:RimJ/RimL family protein N-acetyltransferase